jgi:hypothetical protein
MYPPALQEKNEKNCEAFQKAEHLLEQAFCLLKHPHKGKITLGEEPSDYTEKIGAVLYNVYISPNKDV